MYDEFLINRDCPLEKTFKTYFGELKNLYELKKELQERGDDFYFSYVNEKENHFSNWIEHVFLDKELADELRNAKNSKEAVEKIAEKLNYVLLHEKFNKNKKGILKLGNKLYDLYKYELQNNFYNLTNTNDNKIFSNRQIEFNPEFHIFEKLEDIDFKKILSFQNLDFQKTLTNKIDTSSLSNSNQNFSLNKELLSNSLISNNFNKDKTLEIEKDSITKKPIMPPPPLLPFGQHNTFSETSYNQKLEQFDNVGKKMLLNDFVNSLSDKKKEAYVNEFIEKDLKQNKISIFEKFLKFLR
ncbi:MAG: hypothetical protein QXE31_03310 [Candidatus Woesearchaeota archaeon]